MTDIVQWFTVLILVRLSKEQHRIDLQKEHTRKRKIKTCKKPIELQTENNDQERDKISRKFGQQQYCCIVEQENDC